MSRQRRAIRYPAAPFPIAVPIHIWDETLAEIARYGTWDSEALLFWGGVVSGEQATVTGLYLPGHQPQGAGVRILPEEGRWLLHELAKRDEKLLAQVHSHPGEAYHSHGDDQHATSYHPGSYSIVIPHYGRGVTVPTDCAIYVFDGTTFAFAQRDEELVRLQSYITRREATTTASKRRSQLTWISEKLKQRLTAQKKH